MQKSENEKLITLDEQERVLSNSDIVIADKEQDINKLRRNEDKKFEV